MPSRTLEIYQYSLIAATGEGKVSQCITGEPSELFFCVIARFICSRVFLCFSNQVFIAEPCLAI
jgi:hypothetical protein